MNPTSSRSGDARAASALAIGSRAAAGPACAAQAARRALRRFAPWLVPIAILIASELAAKGGALSTRILPEPLAAARAPRSPRIGRARAP